MSALLDPHNQVSQVFYRRCGIHPTNAKQQEEQAVRRRPEPPNLEHVYVNVKVTPAERWYQP